MTDDSRPPTDDDGSPDRWGRPTRWTLIRRAAGREAQDEEVTRAWEDLVARYEEPVRASVKRLLGGHPESDEIAEGFFSYLFSQRLLEKAKPDAGRFRCFIQGVIKRYVKLARRERSTGTVPIAECGAEAPREHDSLEDEEEVAWALTVLENAMARLEATRPRDGRLLLRAFGVPPHPRTSRRELARESGMTENSVNVAIHRARDVLRTIIAEEIRDTVESTDDLDLELSVISQRLFAARPGLLAEGEDQGPAAPSD